ncbi:MAG: DUF4157 domain-containing protein [Phenylobacterium sp.]|uniref:eCIS core domain-containing protein n=1 Tax=Phenylobacterium sp. TaxID=1871053 RepID=UPI00271A3669|nr:DUF4157 domain-containing protein [Phenylobacterium sp.]MDO8408780.1 DUF4157 domain-containing protein [Phenylobacterium sp.]
MTILFRGGPQPRPRAWRPFIVPGLAVLMIAGCSGEPNEAQLRPPSEWRASVEESARHAADRTRRASEEVLRRSPAVAAPALAQAIRFSRAEALRQTPEAMPEDIRIALSPYFDEEILETARWTLAGQDLGLGSLLARWYYDEGAITLHDVIVFSDAKVAQNVWLWAHELAHVEQYRRMGLNGFALRYVTDWRLLEAQASSRAFAITADIRALRAARPSPIQAVMETVGDMLDLSEPTPPVDDATDQPGPEDASEGADTAPTSDPAASSTAPVA